MNDNVPSSVLSRMDDPPRFQCDLCSMRFKANAFLERHIITHHTKEKPFKCDQCDARFSRPDILKTHSRIHSDKRNYSCVQCDKTFRFKVSLDDHFNMEHRTDVDRVIYQCSLCPSYFFTPRKLGCHRKKVHFTERMKKFLCDTCPKTFDTEYNLKQHIDMHAGLKRFVCDLCPKTFTQNSNLTTHKKTHLGGNRPRPFSCNQCDKTFAEKSKLAYHVKVCHERVVTVWCPICHRGFVEKRKLTVHLRSHSEDRPNSCEFCEKAFKDGNTLRLHIKLHLGEKHYSCDKCDKAYVQEGNLRKHQEKCGKKSISKRKEGIENSWNIY